MKTFTPLERGKKGCHLLTRGLMPAGPSPASRRSNTDSSNLFSFCGMNLLSDAFYILPLFLISRNNFSSIK
jgi:hypothetical protein